MASYYDVGSSTSSGLTPQMDIGALLKSGSALKEALGSVKERELADKAQAQKDLLFGQQQEAYKRGLAEQTAADEYLKQLAPGTQIKGGVLNTPTVMAEADKYALTPDEILKSSLYKDDEAAARKAGEVGLADKLAWQSNLSNKATELSSSGLVDESRSAMYDRIMNNMNSAGLLMPKEAVASADAARLAEASSLKDKLAENEKARAKIADDQLEMTKYMINKAPTGGSSKTVTDTDGNTFTIAGQAREAAKDSKDAGKGLLTLQETINKLPTDADKKGTIRNEVGRLVATLTDRGVNADVASNLVANEMSISPSVFLGFGGGDPKINVKNVNEYADQLVKRIEAQEANASVATPQQDLRYELSKQLASQAGTSSENQLAKLDAERALLLGGEDARTNLTLTDFLTRGGVLPKAPEVVAKEATSKNLNDPNPDAVVKPVVNRNIKSIAGVPDSLVAAEGVTNKAYKLPGEGYTVGMGYNIDQNAKNIAKDFKDANIPSWKLELAKNNPKALELTDNEATQLAQVAYFSRIDDLDKILGGTFDKKSPEMQATAMQMMYRGDLNSENKHGKTFLKLIKDDDYEGLTNYVTANAPELPAPIVKRFNLDLGMPNKEKIRGESSMKTADEKKAYLTKALNGKVEVPATVEAKKVIPEGPSSVDIKKELDALNAKKYATLEDIPVSAMQDLNKKYAEAVAREKSAKDEKRLEELKTFNWGRKVNNAPEYEVTPEEKALRALRENPNAKVPEDGLVDMSGTFIPLPIGGKAIPGLKNTFTRNTTDDFLSVGMPNVKNNVNSLLYALNKNKDTVIADPSLVRSIFGKAPVSKVQGVTRPIVNSKLDLLEEMIKLRNIQNPTAAELSELARLNSLMNRPVNLNIGSGKF